jgi:hypothetical protein
LFSASAHVCIYIYSAVYRRSRRCACACECASHVAFSSLSLYLSLCVHALRCTTASRNRDGILFFARVSIACSACVSVLKFFPRQRTILSRASPATGIRSLLVSSTTAVPVRFFLSSARVENVLRVDAFSSCRSLRVADAYVRIAAATRETSGGDVNDTRGVGTEEGARSEFRKGSRSTDTTYLLCDFEPGLMVVICQRLTRRIPAQLQNGNDKSERVALKYKKKMLRRVR